MVAYSPGGFSPHHKHSTPQKKPGVLVRCGERLGKLLGKKKNAGPCSGFQQAVLAAQQQRNPTRYYKAFGSAAIIALCLSGAIWGTNTLLMQSDTFRVTDLRVRGNRVTSPEQILSAAGVEQGINLFAVKKKAVTGRIAELDWVKEARVTKLWPSGLEISISEHRPVALVNVKKGDGNVLYYIDKYGELFAQVEKGQDVDFPVITGISNVDGEQGLTEISEQKTTQAALHILKYAARGNANLPIQSISEIHVDKDEGLIVYLVEHPFPIYFGIENVYTKYYRLVKILERLYRKEQIAGVMYIRVEYMENKILVARADFDR
ncbi:MAG: hypothetical protein CSB34_00025 [Desulfobulbus propionicus]|nr:MAG: hypothetical protein CSB34_00025 [Desulfobulbus propionicus]